MRRVCARVHGERGRVVKRELTITGNPFRVHDYVVRRKTSRLLRTLSRADFDVFTFPARSPSDGLSPSAFREVR